MDSETRQQPVSKNVWRSGMALPVSVIVHAMIAAVFLLELPISLPVPDEPESVQVELVEPPEPSPEPEPPPAEPEPEPQPPAEEEQVEAQPEEQAAIPTLPAIPIRPEPADSGSGNEPGAGENHIDPAEVQEPQPDPGVDEDITETDTRENSEPAPNTQALPPVAEDGEIPTAPDLEDTGSDLIASPTDTNLELPDVSVVPVPGVKPDNRNEARALLSKNTLSSPGMRQMLGDLPPRRRIVQMCSIEALAQIRQQRVGKAPAQGLVPFSEQGGLINDNVLDARGGAFNVGNDWYGIEFHCEVNMESFTVTAFRFTMGGAVPEAEARRRGYPRQ